MKKIIFLLLLILGTTSSLYSQTWDILNKSMARYNQDDGVITNQAWSVIQGSSAGSVVSQQTGYVNFTKLNAGSTARWAWLRPTTAISSLIIGTPYSIEVKARVHPTGIVDNATNYEANQISLRLGSKNTAARFFLQYGDGINNGSVTTTAGSSNTYKINTSIWQVYRLVFHPDHLKYDIYISGIETPIFEDIPISNTGDQNGIYFGAESPHRCNIDVEYVKMGTGDFFSKPKIVSISLSSNSQEENNGKTITVTAHTAKINDGTKLLISFVDSYGKVLFDKKEVFVLNDKAEIHLDIPSTLVRGSYFINAEAPNGMIDEVLIKPKKTEFLVCMANKLPDWAFGGFVRPEGKNPVIEPDTTSIFFCPMNQADVRWEESDTFNPAAVVKDGKICVLYRAEDNSATGIGKRVSRVALAETTDGITMERRETPIFYPDNDNFSKIYEWPGGCEDPRVSVTDDGTYVMFYTGWDRTTARLCVATSPDLITWKRNGPIFSEAYGGKYLNMWTKSASIVTELKEDRQVVARMNFGYMGKNWQYFMYWGEARTYAAVSDDLVNWIPIEDSNGKLLVLANTRRGYFDSSLVECGPPAVKTENGIIMFYNGRNATNADADPRFNKGTYSAGQMLFDLNDPLRLLDRTNVPFFRPMEEFEKSGQYASGTVFIEGLVYYKQKWYLYYGCADSKVGVAIFDPSNSANGDPIPDYPGGEGIAYYPSGGIGKKVARIHSSSGHTKESEGAFNLLYNYLSPRKWCEDKSINPWVIFELSDYYNIEKTVFRDVAPYENGNGNVPEYWIFTSVTGTEEGDWKELVHKTNQQSIDVKEDLYDLPEEARYIKFVASRGIRTDNGISENAIRIYGFDIYGTFSRSINRGNVVSIGKRILGFYDASEYYCQPLHLLDGDAINKLNRWNFNYTDDNDLLKYVVIDLEDEYEIEKFVLYDAGVFEEANFNIDSYNIYAATSTPKLDLMSKNVDNNTVWTKVVETQGRRDENIKIDNIIPILTRYVKLEIPRSIANSTVKLYKFDVYKKEDTSDIIKNDIDEIHVVPNILKSGDNITVKNLHTGILNIFNLQGILLVDKVIASNETVVPIKIPSGTYIVELKNNSSRKVTKLIVI